MEPQQLVRRRRFLASTTLPLFAPALARADAFNCTPAQAPPLNRPIVTFDEPDFPIVDAGPLVLVPAARAGPRASQN